MLFQFVVAGNLQQGDTDIESNLNGHHEETVIKEITAENDQLYFGLNCRESVVFANGLQVSTFGRLHVLPSLWMKYVGGLFGINRASKMGDFIVTHQQRFQQQYQSQ
jgi:hypothetical protein